MAKNWKLEKLQNGETFETSERGDSMIPKLFSGQKHILAPVKDWTEVEVDDIVYAKIKGRFLTHLVTAKDHKKGCQISNNHGFVNGWTKSIYGKVIEIIKL